nr:putative reverse transcriptase, RNA-dependent DNA polymerase [Tanacetum cinerariifolium]
MIRQKAILDLALQFVNACTTKDDLRKTYEKSNDIPQESRALINTFLKEGSDKYYELNLSMYEKTTKIEKQIKAKLVWLREKYNYRSQIHIGGSSSQTYEIGVVYLTCETHLISWQCKKQTVIATSSTEAKYVAAASGCAQVLWMQNQLLDYGNLVLEIVKVMLFTSQQMVFNSACLTHKKELIHREGQTATGKESSDPFMAEKSDASKGFAQIIDFLSGSYINYALTGDVTRLQALVDKKKIVISEDAIREILRFDDAEGVVCLPNEEIFAGLAQMRYEKPSTKLTFYKAFFSKEEVQVLAHDDVDQENVTEELVDDVAQPTSPLPPSPVIPSSPPQQLPRTSPSQAAEGSSILIQQVLDKCSALVLRVEGLESANTAQQLEILKLKVRMKKLERLNKGRISVDIDERIELVDDQEKDAQVKRRQAGTQAKIYNIDLDHTSKVLSMQEDTKVQEVVEVVNAAKLMTEVATTAASIPIPTAEPAVVAISTAKPAAKPKVLKVVPATPVVSTRKRKGVIIRDPEEELHDDIPAETQSAKDKGKAKGIRYIRRYHGYKKKPQSESEAHKNMIAYLKNTEGFKMAFFKGKTYDQIRPIFQARFDANMRFLLKSKEEMEKEEEEIIKSINETPTQKAAKRRRLHEQAKEDENLKKQLEVVADEDDDVFVEATPIVTKVPVVNYKIVMINNKPRYKIFRADDTHQLYTSFITLLKKSFDREDLEDLWKIMKAIFSTSKLTNFTDDYLLVTLKTCLRKQMHKMLYGEVNRLNMDKLWKRKGVVIRDLEEELHDDTPAEIQSAKDKGKGILVKDPKPIKKKDQIAMDAEYARKLQEEEESHAQAKDVQPKDAPAKGIQYIRRYHGYKKKPQFESEARKNMIAYLKNTEGFKMAFFKGKTYDQIRPIFQARKVLVVNYEIVMISNKPRYKIFKADDTHQLYTSFITLLKNFNRKDLEDLWKIMKARFSTSKPTNFTDDYLLVTLKNMFEKTDAQDVIWRSQQTEHGQALILSALKNGSDFSAPIDRNQFNAASFPLRLCTSLSVRRSSKLVLALTIEGLALIPCLVMRCPRNGPFLTLKEHFFRLSFILMDRSLSKVSCISFNMLSSEVLFDYHVIHISFNVSPDLITGYLID